MACVKDPWQAFLYTLQLGFPNVLSSKKLLVVQVLHLVLQAATQTWTEKGAKGVEETPLTPSSAQVCVAAPCTKANARSTCGSIPVSWKRVAQ